jgi:tyrosyl-tRNA synthetase
MEAKKRLARTIVAGFHSEEAARKADEDWAMQFQQRNVEAVAEQVVINFRRVVKSDAASLDEAVRDRTRPVYVDVAKLLVELGLKESRTDADRQVNAGVNIDGVSSTEKLLKIEARPARITIRVGKRAKIAVIE